MSGKPERGQARETVAAYHQSMLSELVAHVEGAIDRFRDCEPDAVEVDRVLFQYSRAAKELWKFCNMTNVEMTAHHLQEGSSSPIDWWERGGTQAALSAKGRTPSRSGPPIIGKVARTLRVHVVRP